MTGDIGATRSSPRPLADRSTLGAVYTPAALATWVSELVHEFAPLPITSVLDPACGDGALLNAYASAFPDVEALHGIDLSASATQSTLANCPGRVSVEVADSLCLNAAELPITNAVVMNPPWGAEVSLSRDQLISMGYESATGQFDSWNLFVEWTLKELGPDTTVGAIVPDAIFSPEHEHIRRMLLDHTDLCLVSRLGEGWFEGVSRGVAVVVYVVRPTRPTSNVRTVRLPHDLRRKVLEGSIELLHAARSVEQHVALSQMRTSPTHAFTLEVSNQDGSRLEHFAERGGDWTEPLKVGRGVEIGKAGILFRCAGCDAHQVPSLKSQDNCKACGTAGSLRSTIAVIRQEPPKVESELWRPLIVGEDVKRYSVQPSRWLRLGLNGLRYKDPQEYSQRKLLVRKTGLGLNAAIDNSGSYTTQVVFHYLPKPEAPDFYIDYLQGVLCSRILLAYHLRRTGETEWRSHPYVTPRTLKTLPIPLPETSSGHWNQAQAISRAVQGMRAATGSHRRKYEIEVERLTAGLFDLDADACQWVADVIATTQKLHAFTSLDLGSDVRILPRIAA